MSDEAQTDGPQTDEAYLESPDRSAAGEPVDGDGSLEQDAGEHDGGEQTSGGASPAGQTRSSGSRRAAQLEREAEIAADFLETLLDIADLDGDIDVDSDGDRAEISVVDSEEGRVPRRLIGDGGKTLDALQELTRLAVQAETGERSRLMLDIAGHRAQRRADLVAQAEAVAQSVRESGERQAMEPMTAFERKVVHDAVLAAGLSSESEGADPRRYVVVLPTS